jgi:HEAT repeat protein
MKSLMKLATVAALVVASAASPRVYAGKGGSEALIVAAIKSGSVDAVIAEVEKTESLMCDECQTTITDLLSDDRFAVREVAAWWVAKRPGLLNALAQKYMTQFDADSISVRNAADFLGRTRHYQALPVLETAMSRSDLSVEARLALVGALGYMAHVKGDKALQVAMHDSSAEVRTAAVLAYRNILEQTDFSPVVPLLEDVDAAVRGAAAGAVGAHAVKAAVKPLMVMVVKDPDPTARRNAAWALGKIGDRDARVALNIATFDQSALVRGVAKVSLTQLGDVGAQSLR